MKLAALALLFAAVPGFSADGFVTSSIVKHLKVSKEYTIAIAKQMPAENYAFKPNPEEMSFGEQMNHIASALSYFGTILDGGEPKEYKSATKEATIESLGAAFDTLIARVDKMKDAQLHEMRKGEGQDMSILDALMLALDHTAHHRAQCIVYLRVKGIKPVDFRF